MDSNEISVLPGCYLLVILGEPLCDNHKGKILQRVAKGLLSWNTEVTQCDLKHLEQVCDDLKTIKQPCAETALLLQHSTDKLAVEVLFNPQIFALKQCFRNLLLSPTGHKHIIYAGYSFTGSGAWILQDGIFRFQDFIDELSDPHVTKMLSHYPAGCLPKMHLHCAPIGDWVINNLDDQPFSHLISLSLNPPDSPNGVPGASNLLEFIENSLENLEKEEKLESSPLIGNIRFERPTMYIFPSGQGDCSLFGITGFTMLIDGGFTRVPCFWKFVRHIERLDSVMLTRINESNLWGILSLLRGKEQSSMFLKIGYVFSNLVDKKGNGSEGEGKQEQGGLANIQSDPNDLVISIIDVGNEIASRLKQIGCSPHQCLREPTLKPLTLYSKVGHGTLEMYVLSPPRDSRLLKDFLSHWSSNRESLPVVRTRSACKNGGQSGQDIAIPLSDVMSICCLIVWKPADPADRITRILFPGSTPQSQIIEGLSSLKELDLFSSRVCTRSLIEQRSKQRIVKSSVKISEKVNFSSTRYRSVSPTARKTRVAYSKQASTELADKGGDSSESQSSPVKRKVNIPTTRRSESSSRRTTREPVQKTIGEDKKVTKTTTEKKVKPRTSSTTRVSSSVASKTVSKSSATTESTTNEKTRPVIRQVRAKINTKQTKDSKVNEETKVSEKVTTKDLGQSDSGDQKRRSHEAQSEDEHRDSGKGSEDTSPRKLPYLEHLRDEVEPDSLESYEIYGNVEMSKDSLEHSEDEVVTGDSRSTSRLDQTISREDDDEETKSRSSPIQADSEIQSAMISSLSSNVSEMTIISGEKNDDSASDLEVASLTSKINNNQNSHSNDVKQINEAHRRSNGSSVSHRTLQSELQEAQKEDNEPIESRKSSIAEGGKLSFQDIPDETINNPLDGTEEIESYTNARRHSRKDSVIGKESFKGELTESHESQMNTDIEDSKGDKKTLHKESIEADKESETLLKDSNSESVDQMNSEENSIQLATIESESTEKRESKVIDEKESTIESTIASQDQTKSQRRDSKVDIKSNTGTLERRESQISYEKLESTISLDGDKYLRKDSIADNSSLTMERKSSISGRKESISILNEDTTQRRDSDVDTKNNSEVDFESTSDIQTSERKESQISEKLDSVDNKELTVSSNQAEILESSISDTKSIADSSSSSMERKSSTTSISERRASKPIEEKLSTVESTITCEDAAYFRDSKVDDKQISERRGSKMSEEKKESTTSFEGEKTLRKDSSADINSDDASSHSMGRKTSVVISERRESNTLLDHSTATKDDIMNRKSTNSVYEEKGSCLIKSESFTRDKRISVSSTHEILEPDDVFQENLVPEQKSQILDTQTIKSQSENDSDATQTQMEKTSFSIQLESEKQSIFESVDTNIKSDEVKTSFIEDRETKDQSSISPKSETKEETSKFTRKSESLSSEGMNELGDGQSIEAEYKISSSSSETKKETKRSFSLCDTVETQTSDIISKSGNIENFSDAKKVENADLESTKIDEESFVSNVDDKLGSKTSTTPSSSTTPILSPSPGKTFDKFSHDDLEEGKQSSQSELQEIESRKSSIVEQGHLSSQSELKDEKEILGSRKSSIVGSRKQSSQNIQDGTIDDVFEETESSDISRNDNVIEKESFKGGFKELHESQMNADIEDSKGDKEIMKKETENLTKEPIVKSTNDQLDFEIEKSQIQSSSIESKLESVEGENLEFSMSISNQDGKQNIETEINSISESRTSEINDKKELQGKSNINLDQESSIQGRKASEVTDGEIAKESGSNLTGDETFCMESDSASKREIDDCHTIETKSSEAAVSNKESDQKISKVDSTNNLDEDKTNRKDSNADSIPSMEKKSSVSTTEKSESKVTEQIVGMESTASIGEYKSTRKESKDDIKSDLNTSSEIYEKLDKNQLTHPITSPNQTDNRIETSDTMKVEDNSFQLMARKSSEVFIEEKMDTNETLREASIAESTIADISSQSLERKSSEVSIQETRENREFISDHSGITHTGGVSRTSTISVDEETHFYLEDSDSLTQDGRVISSQEINKSDTAPQEFSSVPEEKSQILDTQTIKSKSSQAIDAANDHIEETKNKNTMQSNESTNSKETISETIEMIESTEFSTSFIESKETKDGSEFSSKIQANIAREETLSKSLDEPESTKDEVANKLVSSFSTSSETRNENISSISVAHSVESQDLIESRISEATVTSSRKDTDTILSSNEATSLISESISSIKTTELKEENLDEEIKKSRKESLNEQSMDLTASEQTELKGATEVVLSSKSGTGNIVSDVEQKLKSTTSSASSSVSMTPLVSPAIGQTFDKFSTDAGEKRQQSELQETQQIYQEIQGSRKISIAETRKQSSQNVHDETVDDSFDGKESCTNLRKHSRRDSVAGKESFKEESTGLNESQSSFEIKDAKEIRESIETTTESKTVLIESNIKSIDGEVDKFKNDLIQSSTMESKRESIKNEELTLSMSSSGEDGKSIVKEEKESKVESTISLGGITSSPPCKDSEADLKSDLDTTTVERRGSKINAEKAATDEGETFRRDSKVDTISSNTSIFERKGSVTIVETESKVESTSTEDVVQRRDSNVDTKSATDSSLFFERKSSTASIPEGKKSEFSEGKASTLESTVNLEGDKTLRKNSIVDSTSAERRSSEIKIAEKRESNSEIKEIKLDNSNVILDGDKTQSKDSTVDSSIKNRKGSGFIEVSGNIMSRTSTTSVDEETHFYLEDSDSLTQDGRALSSSEALRHDEVHEEFSSVFEEKNQFSETQTITSQSSHALDANQHITEETTISTDLSKDISSKIQANIAREETISKSLDEPEFMSSVEKNIISNEKSIKSEVSELESSTLVSSEIRKETPKTQLSTLDAKESLEPRTLETFSISNDLQQQNNVPVISSTESSSKVSESISSVKTATSNLKDGNLSEKIQSDRRDSINEMRAESIGDIIQSSKTEAENIVSDVEEKFKSISSSPSSIGVTPSSGQTFDKFSRDIVDKGIITKTIGLSEENFEKILSSSELSSSVVHHDTKLTANLNLPEVIKEETVSKLSENELDINDLPTNDFLAKIETSPGTSSKVTQFVTSSDMPSVHLRRSAQIAGQVLYEVPDEEDNLDSPSTEKKKVGLLHETTSSKEYPEVLHIEDLSSPSETQSPLNYKNVIEDQVKSTETERTSIADTPTDGKSGLCCFPRNLETDGARKEKINSSTETSAASTFQTLTLTEQQQKEKEATLKEWGNPLGLPPTAADSKANRSSSKSRAKSSDRTSSSRNPRSSSSADSLKPIYLDLAYIPHHGDRHYCNADYFKKIRARYYVLSGVNPSKEVLDALIEGKQSWEDKTTETTLIPSHESEVLCLWMATNQKTLETLNIEVAPSASRCSVILQDQESSCSAYRVEF